MTPRERFVEAMNYLHGFLREPEVEGASVPKFARRYLRQAVEAFADAECSPGAETGEGRCYPDRHEAAIGWTHEKMHTACRAALLRDCGLSDAD